MIDLKRIIALIPARGGSKGIKGKNITDLLGQPLISYTISAAQDSQYIDDVIVSTDSEEIANISRIYGAEVPFLRPEELATDVSKTIDTVLYTINRLREMNKYYDILILLQPTQPLRDKNDIDNSIEEFVKNKMNGLASVCEIDEHPILTRKINQNGELIKLLDIGSTQRRQDFDKYYRINGCIYINAINTIDSETSFNDNKIPYIMLRSHSVDIDEPVDLEIAKYYLKSKKNNN